MKPSLKQQFVSQEPGKVGSLGEKGSRKCMECKVRAWSLFRASGSLACIAWLVAVSCTKHQYCVEALFVALSKDITYCDITINTLVKYKILQVFK